jgi:hypothetical protein
MYRVEALRARPSRYNTSEKSSSQTLWITLWVNTLHQIKVFDSKGFLIAALKLRSIFFFNEIKDLRMSDIVCNQV